jgi:hypothetical protein
MIAMEELPHRRPGGEGRDYLEGGVTSAKFRSRSQFNREASKQALCRLSLREECRERLLRIIGSHALREHFVLKFHCLLQLFA